MKIQTVFILTILCGLNVCQAQTTIARDPEIEQMVKGGLFRAFADDSELAAAHLREAAHELIPLATLYEEKIQALRQWGYSRARPASADRRTLDLFGD